MNEAIEKTLRAWYPALDVTVVTFDYGNRLSVTIRLSGRRFVWHTPDHYDYRSQSMEYWLHRFSEAIKSKT